MSTRRNGPYAPLGTNYYLDDAIIEAGERAEVLFCRSLAFCAGTNSDGYITTAQVKRIAIGLGGLDQRIATLVGIGLWTKDDGGYQIRGWLKWNKSADDLGRVKAKDRERKTAKKDLDSERIPDGTEPDSIGIPPGLPDDSEPHAPTRVRGTSRNDTSLDVTSRETALTEDPTSSLLAEHVMAFGHPPGLTVQSKTKVAIMRAVADKTPPELIRAGLARMRDRHVGPNLLPDLIAEVTPTTTPSTTDQRVGQTLNLAAKYDAQEAS